ncbi:Na(+)/H(+) antiporter subunit F1 [Oceanobacillus saliphilus]|uniref:Na(+)/H(+) antiporter subunit F1 n=1 Tax=Oceanobacillus saliphilus TaxID=2925834 RepID=UPI00201DE916|nr:Na(+)/H(+) antiporter subunit F1 [Oceanobacillus saliphilus]
MFEIILMVALVIMSIALLVFFIRTLIGPSIADRILGLDAIGVTLVGFIGILMILQDTIVYSDVVLVLSILSFVSTVALSKFLERGAVFERGD